MTSRVRVGLIGCGRIARLVHLKVLRRLPGVDLVALAEPDPQRRAEAARLAPAARGCGGYQELLEMRDVDAVVICAPTFMHADVAVDAVQRGKHVYLEKPIALNLIEAARVLAAWRRTGLVGMMGLNYRFNPLFAATKRQIQSGRLGELVGARSVFSTSIRPIPDWQQTRARGGGALLDLASHHIDLMRFLFDQEVRDVAAAWRTQRSEEDSAMLRLRLADGLLIQSFFSLCAVEEDRVEIYGQAGKLTVDRSLSLDVEISGPTQRYARVRKLARTLRGLRRVSHLVDKVLTPGHEPSFRAALARFVMAVRSGRPAAPDFVDGYRCLAVVEAAETSARTGCAVPPAAPAEEEANVRPRFGRRDGTLPVTGGGPADG
jgi:myo-inositol 2-dehydrogenase / D-chiro-inositol 1-dehydrogenase